MKPDCFDCKSFDVCETCSTVRKDGFLLGENCTEGHTMVSGLCAIDSSSNPGFISDCPGSRDNIPRVCANCKHPANQGIFYRK